MPFHITTALLMFCVVTLFTPGPNNLMLMASGVAYGFRRSLWHALGVALGFPLLFVCVGLGLARIFDAWPVLFTILKFASAAYLLHMAWGIASAGPIEVDHVGAQAVRKPLSFVDAAAFQWINPKGWTMAVGAASTYTSSIDFTGSVLSIALAFALLGLVSSTTWLWFGTSLRRVLSDEKSVRVFNVVMAALLVASLYPIVFGGGLLGR